MSDASHLFVKGDGYCGWSYLLVTYILLGLEINGNYWLVPHSSKYWLNGKRSGRGLHDTPHH